MFNSIYAYVVPFVFSVFVACFLASLISGLAIILFKLRKTNELFQHPYLKQQAFERYPLSIRLSMLMDYFFRISFPRSRFWLIGDANRLLEHVDPKSIPSGIKWPLIGLWGGCYVGLASMVILWSFLLLKM